MLRISKLADYATAIVVYMARESNASHTAKEVAKQLHIALPTVSKLLKQLQRQELVLSQRGSKGGYQLAKAPQEISILTIVVAVDGDLGLTACSHNEQACSIEDACATKHNWRTISSFIHDTLAHISVADMLQPKLTMFCQLNSLPATAISRCDPNTQCY